MGECTGMKLLAVCVTLVIILLSACEESEEPAFESARTPSQIAEDFVLTETVSGEKAWTLRAEKALIYQDEDLIRIYGVTLDFYEKGGVHYSTLTSDEGIVHTSTNDMEASGNVVVVSEGGRLETPKLNWVAQEERIVTEERVRIIKGETVITGKGLESDPSLERVKIAEEFQAQSIDTVE